MVCYWPGGTGPVGPAIAGPTFELGRIYFLNFKKHCKLLKSKVRQLLPTAVLFNLRTYGIATLDLEIINVSSATESRYSLPVKNVV